MNDPKFSPEKTDGWILCTNGKFEDFPILMDKNCILYIYCERWIDAKACQELYESKEYSAQFPVKKEWTNLPGYFIHLCPKFYNTNN